MIEADSSAQNQAKIFRSVLAAMSHPGCVIEFKFQTFTTPAGLSSEMAALLLTLCDFQTPIWMKSKTPDIEKFLKFYTGAPITRKKPEAAFAVVESADFYSPLSDFAQGTHEYPDRSTTLLFQVDHFTDIGNIELTGPGIATKTTFGAGNLAPTLWVDAIANHLNYPLGVDLIFVANNKLAAIPRSTRVKILEQS